MDLIVRKRLDYFLGGILMGCLAPVVHLLGKVLRRSHDGKARGDIFVIKMLGGGSLVIALPALLGIRRAYPTSRLGLVTTPSVRPFAEALGVFDEIVVVDDRSFRRLALTTLRAWRRCFLVDTILDFEVYSRLTTVFAVLCAGRNRLGFYLEAVGFRRFVCTHLVFFNRFSGSYHFYERMAELIGARAAPYADCMTHMRARIATPQALAAHRRQHIAIGHACSELGRERMLTPHQWVAALRGAAANAGTVELLGAAADAEAADRIVAKAGPLFPQMQLSHACGTLALSESLKHLAAADLFIGIDSALLHFARLLGVPTVSYWGPTDPKTRLKEMRPLDQAHYRKIPCSPCIHVAEQPPCMGNNACIKQIFTVDPNATIPPVPAFGPQEVGSLAEAARLFAHDTKT